MRPICQYCKSAAILVTGEVIYPHRNDLYNLKFWQCVPCDAYVGCHKVGSYRLEAGKKTFHDGTEMLGVLANARLRHAKSAAHAIFDPLWKNSGMSRTAAYAWLAKRLGIPIKKTHIGEFDVQMCVRVIEECKSYNTAIN